MITTEAEQLQQTARRLITKEMAPLLADVETSPSHASASQLRRGLYESGLWMMEAWTDDLASIEIVTTLLGTIAMDDASVAAMIGFAWEAEMLRRAHCPQLTAELVVPALWEPSEAAWRNDEPLFTTTHRQGRVSGEKHAVFSAPYASHAAVYCAEEASEGIAWTKLDGVGVELRDEGSLGIRAARCSRIVFDGADAEAFTPMPRSRLVYSIARLSLLTASCALGAAERAVEEAWAYARERYQGGANIERYDAMRLLHGSAAAALQSGRDSIASAAKRIDDPGGPARALRAKAVASRSAVQATIDAVQTLGGNGYMRDYPLERRLRDTATLNLLPLDPRRSLLLAYEYEESV